MNSLCGFLSGWTFVLQIIVAVLIWRHPGYAVDPNQSVFIPFHFNPIFKP